MNPPVDITGHVFGQLTALEFSHKKASGERLWRCSCSCGGEYYARSLRLRKGLVTKCGLCQRKQVANLQKAKRRHVNGHDIYDVAAKLGMTANAVSMRLARGWNPTDAELWGRRRQTIVLNIPCHMCGAELPKDPVRPWRSRGPVCRACFIEWDKADEASMFALMSVDVVDPLEDPVELSNLVKATASTGGYQGKGTSRKTSWRGEFGLGKRWNQWRDLFASGAVQSDPCRSTGS